MNDDFNKRIRERRQRIFHKSLLIDLALLLPPLVLEVGIILLSFYSFFLSAALTYFVLPMFYTVERRIMTHISGIGNPSYSYADGYKAFFTARQGGVFGVLTTIGFGVILFLASYFLLSTVFPYICNAYPGAKDAYDELVNLLGTNSSALSMSSQDLTNVLSSLLPQLTQPMTILIGASMFLPVFYGIFFSINSHLDDHYLSSIVLPDIDLNISASQARAVSRATYKRYINGERLNYSIRFNWPFYLAFILLYAGSLYLFSLIPSSNTWMTLILIIATPAISFFYGLILNYFCLANHYAIIEEIAPLLLQRLPGPVKTSIYQTYISPDYQHGQESASRGSFVPAMTHYQESQFQSQEDVNQNDFYEPSHPERPKEDKNDEKDVSEEGGQGGVFDFSSDAENTESEDQEK